MDFRLDEEQQALRDAVRRFCAARFGFERLAERDGRPVDRGAWREMAKLGVFSLLVPPADGGLGLGVVEAAIAFEQLGEHLVGGPLLWSALAAPLVRGAASGERLVGGVEQTGVAAAASRGVEPSRASDGSVGVETRARISAPPSRQRVPTAGADPIVVEHAGEIDALLVLHTDGVFACERTDLPPFEPLAPLDPLTPVARCPALPAGTQVGDARDAARLRLVGTVLTAAMQLGVSEAALETSRRYALAREQFGAPIGSFQAVQHLLADMLVRTSLARAATYAAAAVLDDAAAALDDGGKAHDDAAAGDPARAVAAAKLLAGEAALDNARAAVQVHGGMGFTWEMPPNYLLKRAWVLEHAFGTSDEHAFALGGALAEEARA